MQFRIVSQYHKGGQLEETEQRNEEQKGVSPMVRPAKRPFVEPVRYVLGGSELGLNVMLKPIHSSRFEELIKEPPMCQCGAKLFRPDLC